MNKETISIIQNEQGVCISKFESGYFKQIGTGNDVQESVKDLLLKIKIDEAKDAEEKNKIFIKENLEEAVNICIDLYNQVGPDYFDLNRLINKTGLSKEEALLRLNFLTVFELAQPDRKSNIGKRWKLAVSSKDLKAYYFNQSEKWLSLHKYYKELGKQLDKIKESKSEKTKKKG